MTISIHRSAFKLLSGRRLCLRFLSLLTLLFGLAATAQNTAQVITVKGVVKNDSGQPIEKASIAIKAYIGRPQKGRVEFV